MRKSISTVLFILLAICAAHAGEYSRIVSLGPAVTESLRAMGAGDRVAGITTYCRNARDLRQSTVVGSLTAPDIESIVLLRPDLVITTEMTDPRVVSRMRCMGLNTHLVKSPADFDEMCAQFLEIGTMSASLEKARRITDEARRKVERIREKTKDLPRPRVIVQIGSDPLFVASGGRLIDDYIAFAGAENAAPADCRGMYSREGVLADNPDVIIIATMGIGENEKKKWLSYKSLQAAATGRIHIINAYDMCSPTPAVFAATLENLARLFHPETEE